MDQDVDVPLDRPLPTVVVAVMDRDDWGANTDILAVVDPTRRAVTSVPRDLWSRQVGGRINRAWARGGPRLLLAALAEHGLVVDAAVCLRRAAVARALDSATVEVGVDRAMTFLYPAHPELPIEDGAVVVRFDPPSEVLTGVRVHQWLGARTAASGTGSDLERIGRQQTLARALLRDGFPFRDVLADTDRVAITDPAAIASVASIGPDWTWSIVDDVLPRTIGGKQVLVRRSPVALVRHVAATTSRRLVRRLGALAATRVRLPTGGRRPPIRRERLLAVIAVRDEEVHLPGWLANVAPHVDGIVALDDASLDRSAEVLAAHPSVTAVIRLTHDRSSWDEVGNHRKLVSAALDHGATWIIALDADERVEATFRDRVERAVRRGRRLGLDAFALPMYELWDSPATYRSDGVWGRKRVPRLFAARSDHAFDLRPLHAAKAPLQGKRLGAWVTADVRLYHMRMIRPADRVQRRSRYEALDPAGIWQRAGYRYLTDERGCRVRRVPTRRAPDEGAGEPTPRR